jgi:aryl-alcohol dehydrogenase-like predicted oxidoreductase
MIYRDFAGLGVKAPVIGMGCWNIGGQWGTMTDEGAADIVSSALENGVNLFDTAESYGDPHGMSELRLGKALKGRRDQAVIVSKIGSWGFRQGERIPKGTTDSIRLCGHAICGRLQTGHVDVLLCHEWDIQDPSVYIAGFRALREEGFLRAYGISTDSLEVFRRFYEMSDGECAVLEADYSLINRKPEDGLLPFCQEHGVSVLVRGPMAQGLLSGKFDESTHFTDSIRARWNDGEKSRADFLEKLAKFRSAKAAVEKLEPSLTMAEAALRFVISHPSGPIAIPGMTSPGQAKRNAAVGGKLFTPQELTQL